MIRIDDVHATKLIAASSFIEFVPRLHHCIADYSADDKLKGGVLFTDYHVGSVMIHMAGFRKNWVSKAMVYLAFDYPFRQLKVKKLMGMVSERNIVARNADLHLGFKIEHLSPDVLGFEDGVNGMYLMSMYREDCRWLDMPMPYIEYAPDTRVGSISQLVKQELPAGTWMQ
jgi:RimJ/RimL family protein N-acetyltransferase